MKTVLTNKPGWLKASLVCAFFISCGIIQSFQGKNTEPYVLQYPANFGSRFVIPANNPTTKEGVYLGRLLFYDKALSAGNNISCESCHQQRQAFTDGKAFSTGTDGSLTTRSSMSLTNLLWVRNFFWDGRSPGLEEQVKFPLTNEHEMGQPLSESAKKLSQTTLYPPLFAKAFGSSLITEDKILKALSQFERTLISASSNYDHYLAGTFKPTTQQLRGLQLFENGPDPKRGIRGANCGHCHGGVKTFKELFHNNGLDSIAADIGREQFTGQAADRARFRIPTLRNIMLTAPYMHDGRFTTIEQVLDHYSEHIVQSPTLSTFLQDISNEAGGKNLALTKNEKADLAAFLGMLTDSSFISNPAFSNPHLVLNP
ncbi:cytochrome-c peroxidase [Dyadobacter arcticus]|uniref:Cytochrome c peroxidase n=1 Tax=Dyadobacter arcticus TaxID=1078754 RepID=A0ABX0UN57_9BACT|nr:cytochrome c peroxidase [Dyadobacter arcticus]NIJ52521.1 cytochrome c peroxidase [Dyadobacter arcticus]